jgi:hypothetical protein
MASLKNISIAAGVLIVLVLFGWVFTAPYLSNQGLGRTPGLIIGGTLSEAPADFTIHNDHEGPMKFKLEGFPSLVNYLSWVATENGIITATRPDGGYWGERVKAGGNKAWLRLEDSTYKMQAVQITGPQHLVMMEQWAAKSGRTLDEPLYNGSEPLREWEVYYWTPEQ